ncbi:glycosyltransferase family 4 protein [Halorubrum laminariae]|uniref:Glycosyltransferase family 4 protein n=1 Tax=Halorubrum laminariae TaxID=1433523 RepID=A0ABD6C288_9EURY|nr:glycosyltransferase family 4 protein [Halorubrum laminariae]
MDNPKGSVLIRSKVTPYIEDIRGGAGALMMNLGRALAISGWDVHYLSPQPAGDVHSQPNHQRIQFHEFSYTNPTGTIGRLIGSVRGRGRFLSIVEQHNVDVIVDDVSPIPFYPAHIYSSHEANTSLFLHTAPFSDARGTSGWLKGSFIDLLNRSLDYLGDVEIICAGASTEERVQKHLNPLETHVLNPCVGISNYSYKFNVNSKQLLYLGRISKRKNVECLVRAWQRMEQQFPEYDLVIAGDGPLKNEVVALSNELNLQNVSFPGFVSDSEKHRLFRESLLTIIPSYREGYVTTGIESLAAGTPVVGSDTRGINDYIVDGENGFLFETDDPVDLAQTIEDALTESERLKPMAQRGREVSESHSFEQFKRRADNVIHKINESSSS